VRTQYLGTFGEYGCRSAELCAAVPPPEGMRLEQLRRLWGSLPEEAFRGRHRYVVIERRETVSEVVIKLEDVTNSNRRRDARESTEPLPRMKLEP
jgi:hypothetical protein